MKKTALWTFALIVTVGLIFAAKYGMNYRFYKDTMANITIEDVDLSKIEDGVYEGSFDVHFISAQVEATVKNGVIDDIKLISHHNERGSSAEAVIDEVLAKQSLSVDAVSGATNSSKTILKAIENALSSQ